MATLNLLKNMLRQKAAEMRASPERLLSDAQYSAGFNILVRGSGWTTYQRFVIPQLSALLAPLFESHVTISVLEIGPGPKTVLEYLPSNLRQRIRKYAAFEPNDLFATELEERLGCTSETGSQLPCLEGRPATYRVPFDLGSNTNTSVGGGMSNSDERFDVILLCHSMYGMSPKRSFIERALEMLASEEGLVIVFHRGEALDFDGLACSQSSFFPDAVTLVADNDETLDCFASFVAGFAMQDVEADNAIKIEWRKVCRALGHRDEAYPEHLLFSSPNHMATFTQHATASSDLAAQMPLANRDVVVKSREARLRHPAITVRPTEIQHIQRCVRWALDHKVGFTTIGGGHSGHCLWPNVVSLDMGAFKQVHILKVKENKGFGTENGPLVVVGAGCKTGDIIRKSMAAGLTVPLGARPSVGA